MKSRDEQIALLKGSVADWNQWRKENPRIRANLTGANLNGANLNGAYLNGAYLFGADLTDADLTGADLTRAYLYGADLTGAYLFGANLNGANLNGAYVLGADLTDADLTGADLNGAKLRGDIIVKTLIARVCRSDDYLFFGFETNNGPVIWAGCRLLTPDEYRDHVAAKYPGTPKAEETLRIIRFIEDSANNTETTT